MLHLIYVATDHEGIGILCPKFHRMYYSPHIILQVYFSQWILKRSRPGPSTCSNVMSAFCSPCNTCYCWGLAHLLEMYALELNTSVTTCSWVPVTEIQSLEILFRSRRKNIIYTAYVHTFYYINSWTCIVICRSSGMLCSFNCATVTGVAKDWHSFFMCRVKEDNKSQFLILFLFI